MGRYSKATLCSYIFERDASACMRRHWAFALAPCLLVLPFAPAFASRGSELGGQSQVVVHRHAAVEPPHAHDHAPGRAHAKAPRIAPS